MKRNIEKDSSNLFLIKQSKTRLFYLLIIIIISFSCLLLMNTLYLHRQIEKNYNIINKLLTELNDSEITIDESVEQEAINDGNGNINQNITNTK
ncbi:MAG: hypothetical protein RR478_05165 [Bacilli bacterium]